MRSNYKMDESRSFKCLICFEDIQNGISFFDYFKRPDCICGNCRHKFVVLNKEVKVNGLSIYALYEYDDYIEDLMFTFKENKDVALHPIFLYPYRKLLRKKYRKETIVFAPSSVEKEIERGFQTLPLLFHGIKLPTIQLFEKEKEYKQSSKSFLKRKEIGEVIHLRKRVEVPERIVLVDDMCTSGETLKRMYELVKHKEKVKIFTIAINKKLLE